ncbi:hypothetical protein MHBO_000075 [Bonamia ostreae]|uniref:Amino acid permease/ SLC12A domain-containing protein n=1 Tax=Bonamia ostreae TaxID=126728 RepID=A0ABV2AE99_9EUKA
MDENYLNSHNSLMHRVDDPFNQDIKKMKKRKTIFEQSISSSTTFSQKRNSQDDADSVSERNCCGCFFRYCRKTKYGTWDGVFLSCILSIIGVIMFLRLGYIVGQAGIWQTWIVEFVSALVVFLTTLSMSALCSNGEVKHGGAYYLISRSLGPEVGGSIGILFSLGKSIAVAMHTLGIAEPIVDQIGLHITNSKANELRVYGAIILAVLVIIAFIGVGWVIKIQFLMALILVVTIICFIVGCFVTVNPRELIVGVGKGAFKQNFNSEYTKNVDIIAIFGVFFPSMTGIMAGANISGDLANPSKSIPVGTLSAIITSWALYTLMSTFLGSTALRGNLGECAKSTPLTGICQNLIMERIAIPGQIIYAGIYAATISSALASLVGSTRILTKVANDKIVSFLTIFSKKRKSGEPLFAYAPVTIISLGCIMVGSINQIATLVTIAYLITYASINIACFQSSFSKSPGWRPTFKYYNKWVALISGLSCFVLIFVLNYIIAIPASIATFLIFLMIFRNSPNVDWGSANQGFAIMTIVKQLKLLNGKKEHVKNFRPNIIVFSQNPNNDHKLISFLYTLKHSHGANFIGIVQKHLSISEIDEDYFECEAFEKKFVLFRNNFETNDFFFGCTILLKTVGVVH